MRREAGGRGLAYTRTRVRSHMLRAQHNTYVHNMCMYILLAGTTSGVSEIRLKPAWVRPLLVKQVVPAAARRTSALQENKCTSVNEVLYQTIYSKHQVDQM